MLGWSVVSGLIVVRRFHIIWSLGFSFLVAVFGLGDGGLFGFGCGIGSFVCLTFGFGPTSVGGGKEGFGFCRSLLMPLSEVTKDIRLRDTAERTSGSSLNFPEMSNNTCASNSL